MKHHHVYPSMADYPPDDRTRDRRDGSKDNVPGWRRDWSQGFGTITVDGREAVPFRFEGSARLVAGEATRNGFTVEVFPYDDFWAFAEVTK